MKDIILNYFTVFIPLIILFIKAWMKHTIGQKLNEISYADFFLDLPVDLLFISVSMNVTYLLKAQADLKVGFGLVLLHILIAIFSVLLWRACKEFFKSKEKFKRCVFLGFLNYTITIPLFTQIIQLLTK